MPSHRRRHYPRFFELEEFSDYREPNYSSPMIVAFLVLVAALVAFCLCKKTGVGSKGGGCGACASARATRNQEASADGVVHAKDAQHLDELLKSDACVCFFWAPWCGHCTQAKPEYMAAAQSHAQTLYVMCDCENAVGADTLEKHGIAAFPTIRYYKNGRMVDEYAGAREQHEIVAWASSQS